METARRIGSAPLEIKRPPRRGLRLTRWRAPESGWRSRAAAELHRFRAPVASWTPHVADDARIDEGYWPVRGRRKPVRREPGRGEYPAARFRYGRGDRGRQTCRARLPVRLIRVLSISGGHCIARSPAD